MEDRVLHNDPLSVLKHIKNICRNTRRKNVNFKKLMMIIGKIEKVATQTIIEDKKNNPEGESLIEIKSLLMRLTSTIGQLVKNKKEGKVMEEEKDKEKSRKFNLMAQPFIRKKEDKETEKSTITKENEMKEKEEKKEKEELQQLNIMTQPFIRKKTIDEIEETEKTIIRNENEMKNEEKEIEENEKIAETSNEENEISYETIVNHNDTTEESIKESNIITETSDEEFKVTAEIKNKKIDNENEIKEDSTIIKEKIEENEIPTIDTMMDEFDKKVYEINASNVEKMGIAGAHQTAIPANSNENIVSFEADEPAQDLIDEEEIPF